MQWSIQKFETLNSTQEKLEEILRTTDLHEGTVILAKQQNAGKGRHGRIWQNANGNLYFSFLIKPDCSLNVIGQLSLLVGVALALTIEKSIHQGGNPQLKWPNDILLRQKKCAGILLTTHHIEKMLVKDLIIGIGLNVEESPHKDFTSLAEHSPTENLTPNYVLDIFTAVFDDLYNEWREEGFERIKKLWIERCPFINTPITVKNNEGLIRGVFETIDNAGNLLLTCENTKERITINTGDVFLENER